MSPATTRPPHRTLPPDRIRPPHRTLPPDRTRPPHRTRPRHRTLRPHRLPFHRTLRSVAGAATTAAAAATVVALGHAPAIAADPTCGPGTQGIARADPLRITASTNPQRERKAPYAFNTSGSVITPPVCAGVAKAERCTGDVTISIKRAGSLTVSTRHAELRPDCTWGSKVSFTDRSRLRDGRLTVFVHYEGNTYLLPKDAKPHKIRAAP